MHYATFEGLCIGGPQDGNVVAHGKSRMVYMKVTDFPIAYGTGHIKDTCDFENHYYEWTPIVHGYVGLWIHEDLTMAQAIEKLIEGYKP